MATNPISFSLRSLSRRMRRTTKLLLWRRAIFQVWYTVFPEYFNLNYFTLTKIFAHVIWQQRPCRRLLVSTGKPSPWEESEGRGSPAVSVGLQMPGLLGETCMVGERRGIQDCIAAFTKHSAAGYQGP